MTLLGFTLFGLFALRFDLDDYSNIWSSPQAALLFWSVFVVAIVVIVGVTLWIFRRMRPH
jgi:hypothetical protein